MPDSPAFGQADLTNCERELIHLAGSVQPHGVVLVLRESDRVILQLTDNAAPLLGRAPERCLEQPLSRLLPGLDTEVQAVLAGGEDLDQAKPLQCDTATGRTEVLLHRASPGLLVLELEPLTPLPGCPTPVALSPDVLQQSLSDAVRRLGDAPNPGSLSDATARAVRELTGYDRVMVYRFDPDGHGQVIAEARDPRIDPLLGHRYPATDIPQRARELYVRQRVRLLVDVHYQPSPLVPRLTPPLGSELDMSLCGLRSMSPLHLQYLKNMGVTATLVVSLVVGGRLWGLIAAHHYSPRNLRFPLRAACALLAEMTTTRLAAIENYAHAQVALLARRLQQRLVEATSTEGDWRLALFRHPQTLLQPLEATGAVLFHDGELMTAGDVPSTPELRALRDWVDAQCPADPPGEAAPSGPFTCSALAQAAPALAALAPLASGVLAVRLATDRPDWLIWLRREQLHSVTWAGDPTKPMVNDNPLELSPRRSFAAWSEMVRGTALPWSAADLALARAVGNALVDIIVQVHGVRLLIAEQQLLRTRAIMQGAQEPVLVCDAQGRPMFANPAFEQLAGCAIADLPDWPAVCALFTTPETLATMRQSGHRWEGALALTRADQAPVPVQLRAEPVPARDGRPLGLLLTLDDRREAQRAQAARAALEETLQHSAGVAARGSDDPLMQAILTHARLAAMDISEATDDAPTAPALDELADSTRRAATMLEWIRRF
jgi:light-regulated signal transduction histidine kinase (bacteriophytochrome)